MRSCLIGSTGFIGSNLLQQQSFTDLYHSTNIADASGQAYDEVICAGAPGHKWLANRQPERDLASVTALMRVLETMEARRFVLISTIDVYPDVTRAQDETDDAHAGENHSYGAHRLLLEDCVRRRFPHALILRLSGIFGNGLKKNVLHDLMNGTFLEAINAQSTYQWYALSHLKQDIDICLRSDWKLVNVAPKPVSVMEIIHRCFPQRYTVHDDGRISLIGEEPVHAVPPIVHYDIRSRYPLSDRRDVLSELECFVRMSRSA